METPTAVPLLEWDNEPGPRMRSAFLFLLRGDEVRKFTGEDIPGWACVVSTRYTKNGNWSHTTFTIRLGEGIIPLSCKSGLETGFLEEGLKAAACKWRVHRAPGQLNRAPVANAGAARNGGRNVSFEIRTWADLAHVLGHSSAEAARAAWAPHAPQMAQRLDHAEMPV